METHSIFTTTSATEMAPSASHFFFRQRKQNSWWYHTFWFVSSWHVRSDCNMHGIQPHSLHSQPSNPFSYSCIWISHFHWALGIPQLFS